MPTADCIKLNKLINENEKAVRKLNENARQFAFKSILNIVNELSTQVQKMMELKKQKEEMINVGKIKVRQLCEPPAAAPGGEEATPAEAAAPGGEEATPPAEATPGEDATPPAGGGNRYKKRKRKTYKKQKRGGRGKSRRRRKQKSKHRRTKRR